MIRIWLSGLFAVICATALGSEVELDRDGLVTSIGTRVIPKQKEAPIYPRRALEEGVEGWVVTSFRVEPDGTTSDISVVDASISGYFESAAIKATEKFRYYPATRGGQPVIQARNTNLFTFTISDSAWQVSRRFKVLWKRGAAAVENKDAEAVLAVIDKLNARPSKTLSEVSLIGLLNGMYCQLKEDYLTAIRHYERVLVVADLALDPDTHEDVLRTVIRLNAHKMLLGAALEQYENLVELAGPLPPDDATRLLVDRINELIDGSHALEVNGKVEKPCASCSTTGPYWRHILVRSRFTLDDVAGELNDLILLCGYTYVELEFTPGTAWSVNRDWGECEVNVRGAEGTMFRLIELPAAEGPGLQGSG